MRVSPGGDDYEIVRKGSMGRELPLVRTRSGHTMLPISGFKSDNEQEVNTVEEIVDNQPSEWEVLSAQPHELTSLRSNARIQYNRKQPVVVLLQRHRLVDPACMQTFVFKRSSIGLRT